MKQTTFRGDDMTVREFREQRNKELGPDPDSMDHATWSACSECDLGSVQVAQRVDSGLCFYHCYCICHDNPPKLEACGARIFTASDEDDIEDILETSDND